MLDINLFRVRDGNEAETLDKLYESQRRRFAPVELVDEVVRLDKTWRERRREVDEERRKYNEINKRVAKLMKEKKRDEAQELIAQAKGVDKRVQELEIELKALEADRDMALKVVGNLVHPTVPVSNDERENRVERTWGECLPKDGLLNHVDLFYRTECCDLEKGVEVAGGRGFFLKGAGCLLNMALIQYGMQFLHKRGFTPLWTPFIMQKEPMAAVAQLEEFADELYKVTGEGDDKFLIATSEQPIAAFHLGEWMDPKQLPLRYAGFSTCFRKEVGSHGRDTLGIFRIHQFEKIEQFCVTSPDSDESWKEHETMIKTSEEFYQSLGLPFQVVSIVSGALNNAAAKKYDLEAWFPASQTYRELVSCSNCTDFQSRRLGVRFGQKKLDEREKKYVHMLNATLCATERTMCCIFENYQTAEGIRIPDVLHPFMCGVTFIPFVRDLPKEGRKGPGTSKP